MAIPRIRDIVLALPQRLASLISRDFYSPLGEASALSLAPRESRLRPLLDPGLKNPIPDSRTLPIYPKSGEGTSNVWREAATPSYLS